MHRKVEKAARKRVGTIGERAGGRSKLGDIPDKRQHIGSKDGHYDSMSHIKSNLMSFVLPFCPEYFPIFSLLSNTINRRAGARLSQDRSGLVDAYRS